MPLYKDETLNIYLTLFDIFDNFYITRESLNFSKSTSTFPTKDYSKLRHEGFKLKGGAYEVWNYRNTVDFMTNYSYTGGNFHEIKNFSPHDLPEIQNTVQL